jgi:hypothetical protein
MKWKTKRRLTLGEHRAVGRLFQAAYDSFLDQYIHVAKISGKQSAIARKMGKGLRTFLSFRCDLEDISFLSHPEYRSHSLYLGDLSSKD